MCLQFSQGVSVYLMSGCIESTTDVYLSAGQVGGGQYLDSLKHLHYVAQLSPGGYRFFLPSTQYGHFLMKPILRLLLRYLDV